jgi:hypothetical protein
MITIFNGRKRILGDGGQKSIFAQISVDFRNYLHIFKGAKLHVFLAIALHANAEGWAWPSYGLLAKETGYSEDTIRRTLRALCEVTVEGHRILLRFQPQTEDGTFDSNRYLIFPTDEDVKEYEKGGIQHAQGPGFADRCGKTPQRPDRCGKIPQRENTATVKPHNEEEPASKEKPPHKEKPAAAASLPETVLCSLHNEPMKLRTKDGDFWYSHRLQDGSWCKGAPGDQPEDADETDVEQRHRYAEWAAYTDQAA